MAKPEWTSPLIDRQCARAMRPAALCSTRYSSTSSPANGGILSRNDVVFQRGKRVYCAAIHQTALLTVEGERDDICGVGQTAAAHLLCAGLRPHLQRHHLQPGVGHYGVFSGSKWENEIYPQVRNLILAMG